MKNNFILTFLLILSAVSVAQELPAIHMFLPDRKGALELRLPAGYQVEKGGLRPDGKQFTLTAKGPSGIYLTAFVELAPHPGTSTQVRDLWWNGTKKNSKVKMDDQKLTESNDAALAEYTVHEFQGAPVEQRSVHAYYGGDEIWSEVHASKINFKPDDQKLFDDLLSRVTYLSDYVPSSQNEFMMGNTFYSKQDYKRAAIHYQRALDQEKQKPMLNRTLGRVLIDQLGMSYGISGDLAKSKEVFEYGISKDPDYPLFYYNIACGYGEQNDKVNAIAFLKKAFERKANVVAGEKMPDPLTDDSFKKFASDHEFVKEVKAMQQ